VAKNQDHAPAEAARKSQAMRAVHSAERKQRDLERLRAIGKRGGQTVKERHGLEHYVTIGRNGGTKTRDTHDSEYYARIGRLGGLRGKGRPKRRPEEKLSPWAPANDATA
jgi:general stress protein YciG